MKTRYRIPRFALSLTLFVSVFGLSTAFANPFDLDVPNAGLGGSSTGPYASVLLSLNGNAIDFTVTGYAGFQMFGNGNGGGMFGFNVSDDDLLGLSVTTYSFSTGLGNSGTQMDGFGRFEVNLVGPTASNALSSFSFTVTRTNGFNNINQVVSQNSSGWAFAAHIAPTNGNPTGFATSDGTTKRVPEPTSLTLLGIGLLGLALSARKRM